MATTIVKFNKSGINKIYEGLKRPTDKVIDYFRVLSVQIDKDKELMFRTKGLYKGVQWPVLSKKTKFTDRGTPKIRYGTDKKPKRNMHELIKYKTANKLWYIPGNMKGYKSDRRYSNNSKPLQASGSFKRSFDTIKITNKNMFYGTRMKIAKEIMSNPSRPVILYTNNDKKRWTNLFIEFTKRNIRF